MPQRVFVQRERVAPAAFGLKLLPATQNVVDGAGADRRGIARWSENPHLRVCAQGTRGN
jgi:hypothetical protein